jgi:hypothetical protein
LLFADKFDTKINLKEEITIFKIIIRILLESLHMHNYMCNIHPNLVNGMKKSITKQMKHTASSVTKIKVALHIKSEKKNYQNIMNVMI